MTYLHQEHVLLDVGRPIHSNFAVVIQGRLLLPTVGWQPTTEEHGRQQKHFSKLHSAQPSTRAS